MRKFFTLALVVAAMGAASVGCGSKGSGSSTGGSGASGGGGSGGDTGGTTMTTTTTTTTTTMTTAADCTGVFGGASACTDCAEVQCCAEISDCQKDAECAGCIDGSTDPNACAANAQWIAINDCAGASCAAECTPASCNPVTNEGCDGAAGEACDFSGSGYTCYPDGNTHALCEPCGADGDGNYCQGGMTCNKTCAKFCCNDGDCGTGTCNFDLTQDPAIGICVDAAMAAACDAPTTSPSMGTCYMAP